jgi:long-chain acyl-CoA synthetase
MFWEFVAWTFFAVLLPAYYFRKHFGKELTYEHGVAQASMGPIRRNLLTKRNGLVTSPHPNVKTLYDILLHGVKRFHPSRFLFGSRSIERTVTEEKEITDRNGVKTTKSWSFSQLGAYNWMTYNDVFQAISQIGSGLVHLGLRPNDKVTIFASTGRDWMLMAHSCFSQSITITTAYDTLGVDGLAFSINQGEVTTLFTQANLFAVIREIGAKAPSLKTVIYTGKFDEIELLELTKLYPKIQFFSIEQLRQLGIAHEAPTCPPAPEDIACIMYTSGSTGNPKGVMLTHANIVAAGNSL